MSETIAKAITAATNNQPCVSRYLAMGYQSLKPRSCRWMFSSERKAASRPVAILWRSTTKTMRAVWLVQLNDAPWRIAQWVEFERVLTAWGSNSTIKVGCAEEHQRHDVTLPSCCYDNTESTIALYRMHPNRPQLDRSRQGRKHQQGRKHCRSAEGQSIPAIVSTPQPQNPPLLH